VKRSNEGDDWSGGAKKPRGEGNLTLRFLLASKHAGGIIGKGGETIKRLRSANSAQVYVPDNPGNERVLSIGAERDNSINVFKECLPLMHEPPYPVWTPGYGGGPPGPQKDPNAFEINFLVHYSQVGGIIGKSGARIKQIRDETNAQIKVYPDCLPGCKERVVALSGDGDQIVAALQQVLDVMVEQPIKGDVVLYDPSCSSEGGYDDGGYNGGYNGDFNGPMGGPMNNGPGGPPGRGPPGGNFGGPQGGYGGGGGGPNDYGNNNYGGGNNYSNYNNNNQGGPPQGGYGGPNNNNNNNNAGGNFGGGAGGGGGGGNQGNSGNTSTQVTIPNDMAGAIIGQGGRRIQEIRQKCGAQIKFADPEPGKKDRLITISGSDEQIQYAQYLMQQCVLNNSGNTTS